MRKRYTGIGYKYDATKDAFIPPQPFPSWKMDDTYNWQTPVKMPDGMYVWNEDKQEWIEVKT